MAEAMLESSFIEAMLPNLPHPNIPGQQHQGLGLQSSAFHDARSQTGKTVEFDLPAKRQRVPTDTSSRMIVEDLQNGIARQDRIRAIVAACNAFNHEIESVHDDEIAAGADGALCKHLSFLMLKKRYEEDENESTPRVKLEENDIHNLPSDVFQDLDRSQMSLAEEMSHTCEAIEMVYRCSAPSILSSFNRVGSDFLSLIIQIINSEISSRLAHHNRHDLALRGKTVGDNYTSDANTFTESSSSVGQDGKARGFDKKHTSPTADAAYAGDMSLKTCTKIMGHFARVGALTEPLAYHPKVLLTLKRLIVCPRVIVPSEARLNSLWTIANLACNAENMVMMACHPGLMTTLIDCALRPSELESDAADDITTYLEILRSRSIAVRAIRNLSWIPENKIPFSEHDQLVDALIRTAKHRTSSWSGRGRGVSGILLQSRRHAAGALRNLAAAPKRNKLYMCSSRSGSLLEDLALIAREDPDRQVREKILATLNNLACVDTAELFTERRDVLDVLAEAVCSDDSQPNESSDCSTIASHALRILEKSIPEDMASYQTLKPVLDRVAAV